MLHQHARLPSAHSRRLTPGGAPAYPGRFSDPESARAYFRAFFPWYHTEHRHSGLGLLTPDAVHHGRAGELQAARQLVLGEAYAAHPERFVHGAPSAPRIPNEVWINRPANIVECKSIGQ